MQLNRKAFGLTVGLLWSGGLFSMALLNLIWGIWCGISGCRKCCLSGLSQRNCYWLAGWTGVLFCRWVYRWLDLCVAVQPVRGLSSS